MALDVKSHFLLKLFLIVVHLISIIKRKKFMIHGISRRFQKKKKLKLGATFMNGKKEEIVLLINLM